MPSCSGGDVTFGAVDFAPPHAARRKTFAAVSPPSVCVIVPAFDAEATLDEALGSLARQSRRDWRAIVVDDGSSDGTRDRAEAWARRDRRVTVVGQAHAGAAAARNAGLRLADAPWLLFLDSDDWLAPRALERLLAAAERAPHLGVLVGRTARVAANGRRWPFPTCNVSKAFATLSHEGHLPIHSVLVRRSAVQEAGGFDPSLRTSEDWDLWQRIARLETPFGQVDALTAFYRSSPASLSKNVEQVARDALVVMRRGHSVDPRIQAPPRTREGAPASALPSRVTGFVLWSVARAVALGQPTEAVVGLLEGAAAPVNVRHAGDLMAAGIADALSARPDDLGGCWPSLATPLGAVLERLYPDPSHARFRQLTTALVKAQLNGGAADDADVLQLDAPRSFAGAEWAPVQLRWRDRTLGLVVVSDTPDLAEDVAQQAGQLSMVAVLRALRPWTSPAFWAAVVAAALDLRGLGLRRIAATPRLAAPLLRSRARFALAAGVQAVVRKRLGGGRKAPRSPVVAEPPNRSGAAGLQPAQVRDRAAWDSFFAADDPWRYESSAYERLKYADTLECLPEGDIPDALELACAEGSFTELLAPRVERLVATDISAAALAKARARCSGLGQVSFATLDLTGDRIPGAYDLIVCSEVLYYAGGDLGRVVARLAAHLKPGGTLVAAHANVIADEPEETGFDWGVPYGARTIGEALGARRDLELVREIRRPLYRVQAYRKGEAGAPVQRIERPVEVELDRGVARNVVWGGGRSRVAAVAREASAAVPILMYHRVAETGPEALARYRVSPRLFAQQIEHLRQEGYRAVGPDELADSLARCRVLPGRPVVLTFDDGYSDFAEHAWPVLERHDFTAVLSVVTGRVGASADWDADAGPPAPLLDWAELKSLVRAGVHLASHSVDHRRLGRAPAEEIRRGLLQSRAEIAENAGYATRVLCFPYGDHDPVVERIAAGCGYDLAFGVDEAVATLSSARMRLPRVEVSGLDDLVTFKRKLGAPNLGAAAHPAA